MNKDVLKRLLKKVFILLILTILLWLFKLSFVNAETITPSYFRFNNAETLPIEFWTNSGDISRVLTINSAKGDSGGIYEKSIYEVGKIAEWFCCKSLSK